MDNYYDECNNDNINDFLVYVDDICNNSHTVIGGGIGLF